MNFKNDQGFLWRECATQWRRVADAVDIVEIETDDLRSRWRLRVVLHPQGGPPVKEYFTARDLFSNDGEAVLQKLAWHASEVRNQNALLTYLREHWPTCEPTLSEFWSTWGGERDLDANRNFGARFERLLQRTRATVDAEEITCRVPGDASTEPDGQDRLDL